MRVRCFGQGSGGGGAQGGVGLIACAGGGSAGGFTEKWYTGLSGTTAILYTTSNASPAGGVGLTLAAGTNGVDTTFDNTAVIGTTLTAKGGVGALSIAGGAALVLAAGGAQAGVSTGGDTNSGGAGGLVGFAATTTTGYSGAGGGAGEYGTGGGPCTSARNGFAATGYSAAGSGGMAVGTGNKNGGTGAPGLIIVEEWP